MRTIQPKILEIPGGKSNGTEIPGKKFSKIWVYLARLFSFGNSAKWCSIRHWKFFEMQTRIFGQIENAPGFYSFFKIIALLVDSFKNEFLTS